MSKTKTVTVKYTFTATKRITLPEDADDDVIEMEARCAGEQMEFCLEGSTTMEFVIR